MVNKKHEDGLLISDPQQIPKDAHYAIIGQDAFSRYDGYGDSHKQDYITYRAYYDVEKWKADVKSKKARNELFVAAHVTPAQVVVNVDVVFSC